MGPSEGPPVIVPIPEECERLRRELAEARARAGAAAPRDGAAPLRHGGAAFVDDLLRLRQPLLAAGSGVGGVLPGRPGVGASAGAAASAGLRAADAGAVPPAGLPRPELPRPPLEKPLPPQAKEVDSEGAARVFWVGYRSYWQGDYDQALAGFDSAVRLDDEDARFWYYKALAERALGEMEKAEASAKRGRELHAARRPKADLVGAALERVQGQERRFLNAPEVLVSAAEEGR